ncbi:MAG TPA: GspH/FimT family pseudopilin [Longimicrobium sp.]
MSIPARALRAGREGFSLAEMLIVLVILAILASMAVPRIEAWVQVSATQGVLNGLATDLNVARIRAIRTARRVSVTVATTGKSYTVVVDPGTANAATYKSVNLATDYPGLDLTPHGAVVTFDSRGMMTSGNTSTLTATRNGRSSSLTISGVGRIYRGY